MTTVLITGANGFVGKNLSATLAQRKDVTVLAFDVENTDSELELAVSQTSFIFHLAGVNRPNNVEEFTTGNLGLTEKILKLLKQQGKATPLLISSSIQAAVANPYGISKRAAEDAVFKYGSDTGAYVYVYRLPNVFGKWCRPNYNSVIATFCNNISHGLPIQVNDRNGKLNLVYIDDVIASFTEALDGRPAPGDEFSTVEEVYYVTLGEVVDLIHSFKQSRELRSIPDLSDPFTKKLYSTYLSYLPTDQFSYPLKMNIDQRGSFTEFIRTADRGQVSVNISKPGITKGNHWHHTKNEKFLVVSGRGLIQFRRVGSDEIVSYDVSGDKLEVLDIPVGYTHNITNTGTTDMVTVMWCNEAYDPDHPDTFFETV